ncbi:MAG: MFS transporter [Clostridiales bacterium]|nr:MFS transporter [Eubacteriales bacterium]NLO14728.1 MFS transporter [Clostridiales bacterium]
MAPAETFCCGSAKQIMTRHTQQNILFSLFIAILGMMINIFHTMADRMALSLGWPAGDAGMLISIYALGSLLSVVLSSTLADWAGKRRVILVAMGVMCVGFALLFLSHAFVPLAMGLFLFGFGFGPSEGLGSAVLSDENPQDASKWVNIAHAGFGVGAIAGPMLAVAAFQKSGSHHLIFLFAGIVALGMLLWIAFTAKNPRLRKAQGSLSPLKMFELLKEKRFIYLSLMMFFYLGYESVASAYTKQLFLREGSSEGISALMISLFWGSMILGRLVGANLSGRELFSIRAYAATAVLGMVLLTFAPNLPLRVLAVALYGFGCGPTWPMLVVLATRMFPERSGSAMGMMMLSTMGGMTVFPFLIGTLPGNLTVTFLSAAALAALVLALSALEGKNEAAQGLR